MTTTPRKSGRPTREVLPMWTVYERPKDYPKHFVARRFMIMSMGNFAITDDVLVANTLDEVRAMLPPGLYRLDRQPNDDRNIVEVWL